MSTTHEHWLEVCLVAGQHGTTLQAADTAALKVGSGQESWELSWPDAQLFVDALLTAPTPTEVLQRAAVRSKGRRGPDRQPSK